MKSSYQFGILALALLAIGCGSGGSSPEATTTPTSAAPTENNVATPLVFFSQANSADPWRQVFDKETSAAADQHKSQFHMEEQAAEDDPNKQINQLETMALKSPKVVLCSPAKENVQQELGKIYDSGVPVVLLDRGVPGDKYTCLIAGDNVKIGHDAAQYIVDRLKGKGTVLMIRGLGGATATVDRGNGAMDVFKKNPGITVIEGDDCKYQRQAAQNYMETFLQSNKPFDAVYAHNDEMAIGAYQAWSRAAKSGPRPIFVGVDGCQLEMINMIKDGKIDATFQYPIPGPKGVEVASDLLNGKQPPSKKIVLPTQMVTKDNAAKYIADNPSLAK